MSYSMIPVINIDSLNNNETMRALDRACRMWGTFQVVSHGIDQQLICDVHQEMHRFFEQGTEQKSMLLRSLKNPWGFYDRELTKNICDCKEIFDIGPADDLLMVSKWPENISSFKHVLQQYYVATENLAFKLLKAISSNLGLSENPLIDFFTPKNSSFLRLNYYPLADRKNRSSGNADEKEDVSIDVRAHGVNQHTDAGALTILLQDQQSGLEVYNNGRWHLVEPRADALVINLGDIVQVWSNDRYKAPVHRVRASELKRRFSVPFFFNPDYSTRYQPLPSVTDSLNPPRYREIHWAEFRELRAKGDYLDSGEEVQISHYRI